MDFLCNRPDLVASTGPVTGSSASQVRVEGTDMPCIEALDADWQPRVPILFMSGTSDGALSGCPFASRRRNPSGRDPVGAWNRAQRFNTSS